MAERMGSLKYRISEKLLGNLAYDIDSKFKPDAIFIHGSQSPASNWLPQIGSDIDLLVVIGDPTKRTVFQQNWLKLHDELTRKYGKGINVPFLLNNEEAIPMLGIYGAKPMRLIPKKEALTLAEAAETMNLDEGMLERAISNGVAEAYKKVRKGVLGQYKLIAPPMTSDVETKMLDALSRKFLQLSKKEKEDMLARAHMAVWNGVREGKSFAQIAKDIKETEYEKDAMLLARTEVMGAAKQAQIDVAREHDIGKMMLTTAPNACEICADIADGGPYTPEEAEKFGNIHPNCRCSFRLVLEK
jgi:hypothetical protein